MTSKMISSDEFCVLHLIERQVMGVYPEPACTVAGRTTRAAAGCVGVESSTSDPPASESAVRLLAASYALLRHDGDISTLTTNILRRWLFHRGIRRAVRVVALFFLLPPAYPSSQLTKGGERCVLKT